jgi:tRNA C32,U32 (ribose-2'-O)-methylase TrmJ
LSNAENATRFSALGKQALENQKAQEALAGDLAKLNEFIGTAERRIKELEKQVMQHRNKHKMLSKPRNREHR